MKRLNNIRKGLKDMVRVSKHLWKYSKWEWFIYFQPFRIIDGKLIIMRPCFYNGYFSMRSINKVKK